MPKREPGRGGKRIPTPDFENILLNPSFKEWMAMICTTFKIFIETSKDNLEQSKNI